MVGWLFWTWTPVLDGGQLDTDVVCLPSLTGTQVRCHQDSVPQISHTQLQGYSIWVFLKADKEPRLKTSLGVETKHFNHPSRGPDSTSLFSSWMNVLESS